MTFIGLADQRDYTVLCKQKDIFNSMPATHSKKVETEGNKSETFIEYSS